VTKKVVGVFVHFRAPLRTQSRSHRVVGIGFKTIAKGLIYLFVLFSSLVVDVGVD
jgi:hypothetical protein